MKRRVQIVLSSRSSDAIPRIAQRSIWQRAKVLSVGLALAVLALSVLIAAVVFGSILGLLLAVILIFALLAAIIRGAVRQAHE